VPLIEGPCSSNPCGFVFSVLYSHLLLFFFGRKRLLKESQPANTVNCFYPLASLKLGLQRFETVSWVLRGSSDVHHPLSPLNKLGIRHPRNKERKENAVSAM